MINSKDFIECATQLGINFWVGVPCSFLTPLINGAMNDKSLQYVGATSEGEGLAIACGAWLAGKKPILMFQNSGLGNAINPLVSLSLPFQIPILLVTTLRGEPGISDEPQHEVMGEITHELLELCQVKQANFPCDIDAIADSLKLAELHLQTTNLPFAFVMRKGEVNSQKYEGSQLVPNVKPEFTNMLVSETKITRQNVLASLLSVLPETVPIIATTGKTGRELFTLEDHRKHFYQVGSMGCSSAIGLGVALNYKNRVVVIDGDGSLLMKMGNMATIGAYSPENLIHILIDNGVHDSTGGQHTVSGSTDFAHIALACSYRRIYATNLLDDIESIIRNCLNTSGPHFLHIKVLPGSMINLGRPTIAPFEVAQRFKSYLNEQIS